MHTDKYSMKTAIATLIFLYTISSAAQNARYNDGSYYNDDYIHNGQIAQDIPMVNNHQAPNQGVMVGEPDPNGNKFPRKKFDFPKPKKRKPAGGFQEVKPRAGSVGSFKEVGGGSEEQSDSLGSK